MGTRGTYGFRINDQDRITYNHFDSYPECLGRKILTYASQTSLSQMKQAASRIVLVREQSRPTQAQIEKYKKHADLGVSTGKHEEWYCLLRKTQGDLFPYNNSLKHMIDSQQFLLDSLFCEWAYIINLDFEQFEVYRGFNEDPSAPGRYAGLSVKDNDDLFGVSLLHKLKLSELRTSDIDGIVKKLEQMA